MTAAERTLRRIGTALGDLGLGWALVGGWAVSVRTEPRFTRDIDLAVAVPGDAEAEGLVHALASRGFMPGMVVEQDATGRLATVRLVPPGETESGIVVDLLFASSGIEREVVAGAELLEVMPGLVAPVARSAHLLALKVLARDDLLRPLDAADIRALLARMEPAEVAAAGEALDEVTRRGYHRGRDLAAALRQALGGLA